MYSCNKNTANNLLLVLSEFQKKKNMFKIYEKYNIIDKNIV